jgi:hypothetical protein
VNENCNQSSSTAPLLEKLNCLNASANSDGKVVVINDSGDKDDDDDDYEKENDDDKVKMVSCSSSANHMRFNLYHPLATLKNRLATMFQSFSMATSAPSKKNPSCEHHHNSSLMRRNNTFELFTNYFGSRTSHNENFDKVRNELSTLQRFRDCDEEKKSGMKKETFNK